MLGNHFFLKCRFTFTEIIRLIGDGEPRTATSGFTQIFSSDYYYAVV